MTIFNNFLVAIFLVIQFYVWFAYSQTIQIYTEFNPNGGNHTDLDVSTCHHLPKEVASKIVGINNNGNCLRLYMSEDCTGHFLEVHPRPSLHILGNWRYNNGSISMGPCPDQCSVNVTGPPPTEEGLNVTLFDRPFYRGAMETINVKGCHILPRKFNNQINSAITNVSAEGQCFQLYNNVDCQLNWTARHDTVELRPDTPKYDLRNFKLYQAKAISHCSFKCNTDSVAKGVSQNDDQLTNGNQVMLYDDINFKGNGLLISKTEDCVNLEKFVGWEGAAKSVKLHDDEPSCVMLYNVPNCVGDFKLTLNSSKAELYSSRFDTMIRSVQFC